MYIFSCITKVKKYKEVGMYLAVRSIPPLVGGFFVLHIFSGHTS
nr:MAG TPA: hypothetical protein [Caudoviricetes sp.]